MSFRTANVISLTLPLLLFTISMYTAKASGKLPRQQGVAFFEAIDEHLKCRDHRGTIGGNPLAIGC